VPKLSKKQIRIGIIVAVVLVAGYFAYRWYSNRQSGNPSPTGGLGTNLNSVAPELVGGSTGPDSGLDNIQPPETVTINLPNGQPSDTDGGPGPNPPPPHEPCPAGFHRTPNGGCARNPKPKPKRCPRGHHRDKHGHCVKNSSPWHVGGHPEF
jgi:hypothetical protein